MNIIFDPSVVSSKYILEYILVSNKKTGSSIRQVFPTKNYDTGKSIKPPKSIQYVRGAKLKGLPEGDWLFKSESLERLIKFAKSIYTIDISPSEDEGFIKIEVDNGAFKEPLKRLDSISIVDKVYSVDHDGAKKSTWQFDIDNDKAVLLDSQFSTAHKFKYMDGKKKKSFVWRQLRIEGKKGNTELKFSRDEQILLPDGSAIPHEEGKVGTFHVSNQIDSDFSVSVDLDIVRVIKKWPVRQLVLLPC